MPQDETDMPIINASLEQSDYGTPRPTLTCRFLRGTPWRLAKAALHEAAAAVEVLSPAEQWSVSISESGDHHLVGGRVMIELACGMPGEAKRAMAVLEKVASRLNLGRPAPTAWQVLRPAR